MGSQSAPGRTRSGASHQRQFSTRTSKGSEPELGLRWIMSALKSERMLRKRARQFEAQRPTSRRARLAPRVSPTDNILVSPDNQQSYQTYNQHQQLLQRLAPNQLVSSVWVVTSKNMAATLQKVTQIAAQTKSRGVKSGQKSRGVSVSILGFALLALLLCLGQLCATGSGRPERENQNQSQQRRQQLQLLRRASVELTRLPSRLERDTQADIQVTVPVQASSATGTCGYPGSPAHASVTFNSSQVVAGTAASYTCDNGYELLGPPRRLCQANGTWSPVGIPFCVLNVGLGKAAMQSSTAGHGSAQKAVDGSTSPYFQSSTCTMTDVENNPWWYVNLLEPYLVQIVRIDFGTACCGNRQKATIAVRVGNNRPDLGNNPLCNRYHGFIEEGKPLFLPCTRPAPGAFVSIHLEAPSGSALSICETFIYTDHALSIEQCPSFRDQPLGSTATYNGKCYLFHNNQLLNFDNARRYCESRGGTLVDETSPALQGFLSWELYRRHRNDQLMGQYWLGAVRDQRPPQNWRWINGKDVQISFWSSLPSQNNCSRFDGSKGWLWSDTDCQMNLNFICQYRPLSCGKPEKPTNSTLITKNIDNGTVIEYQCAPGNLLIGPKSRACLPTGFFSEFAPKCKYLDCQFPAMIANGDYRLLNGTTSYQSVVTYFCNDGHQIYGKSTLTCDLDERWNGPPPRCEPLLCAAPSPPPNGYVTVGSNITIAGTQATYDCRPGFELIGDRLLTCTNSGSWDLSFPYCREKRVAQTHFLGPMATPTPARSEPVVVAHRAPVSASKPSGTIQFPQSTMDISASSSSSTTTTTSSTTAAPVTPASKPVPSPTASINGQVNQPQLVQQQSVGQQQPVPALGSGGIGPVQTQPAPTVLVVMPAGSDSISSAQAQEVLLSQSRKPVSLIPSSVSQPMPEAPNDLLHTQMGSTLAASSPSSSSQPTSVRFRPSQQSLPVASTVNQFGVASGSRQSGNTGTSRFQFDSTPAQASTTNTFNVLASSPAVQPINSVLASSSAAINPTTAVPYPALPAVSQLGPKAPSLASFAGREPSGRPHNSLASTRYSLDGIIAVAIFGGFIFLGAIITIIVIIIRRKSSHSSSIDAQTISTYDSNGNENNGLYRNYQQAWENLRFGQAGACGLAKMGSSHLGMSGPGVAGPLIPGSQMTLTAKAHASFGHLHHHHHHHAHLLAATATPGRHAQLAGAPGSSASSSAGASSRSSSLGGTNGAGADSADTNGSATGAAPDDPLLRHHSHSHAHLLQHQHQHGHHHHRHAHSHLHSHAHPHRHQRSHELHARPVQDDLEDTMMDDEMLEDEEQGVLSGDEHQVAQLKFNMRPNSASAGSCSSGAGHTGSQTNEGFRDSNELTINADMAPAPVASSSSRMEAQTGDEHSLEQLAYGNGWARHSHEPVNRRYG